MAIKTKDYELNHRAFVLLGLVAEIPSHAYNIDQRINERGMRAWTNIGTSSIYNIINNLEEYGLVESYTEEKDNRIRKVYTITNLGMDILRKKAFKVLSDFIGRKDEDFYVAFSMLQILTYEQLLEAFTTSMNRINVHIDELKNMLAKNSKMPLNVRGLFVHPIKILETDVEFLKWVLEEIKRGETKVGSKENG